MAAVDTMMTDDSDFEEDDFFDDESEFEEENVAPVAKKSNARSTSTKKSTGAKAKKTNSSVLSERNDGVNKTVTGKAGKTVEEIYQKKSQLEHILLRPDTYIGSIEPVTQPMFVLDSESGCIVQKEITFTPGLFKIFDEIMVNAADNKQRDPNMDKVEIVISPENNSISVKNNGKGIPVVIHKEHNIYVPTLIFAHLLTGSNFDDDEKKTTGGRNGYGAKLANVFSTEFIVECVDSEQGLKFRQTFRNNMSIAEEPVVKKCTAKEAKQGDYTMITFSPDLKRFKMSEMDKDTQALLSKRAYDIAGSMANRAGKKLQVALNGKKLPIKNFKDYLKLYQGIGPLAAYEKVDDRWEIGVSLSDGSFQQISFVNAICTSKGGGHVNYIADKVCSELAKKVKAKNKGGSEIKNAQIKNQLCIFVNCLIENPSFDSQTKEFLSTRPKAFGSQCKPSDSFFKAVSSPKSGIVDAILAFAKFKAGRDLKRAGGAKKKKLTGIAKLDDANFAGSTKSAECTLIITEGDSAKSLAMSGLSVVGRDYYGVFPLKGKPLNVRDATLTQIKNNEEVKNLVDIMGLKYDEKYDETSIKKLRYGHLMIMADQDHDGSHIKGLVINFIHQFWPTLLDVPGFLQQFITPIVKATKGKTTKTFFTLPEYEAWKESTGNDGKGYKVKYYKGLGTSTSSEAKEYFSNLDTHEVHFGTLSTDQSNSDDSSADMEIDGGDVLPDKQGSGGDLIDMVFAKKRVEDRKTWLNNLQKDTYLDYSAAQTNGVTFSDFVNKELILFSQADNQRSIPHVLDGFKPSQRKVLYSCLKRKLKGEIKVAQLAGYIGEHSAYHHGENSLNQTIVNMAQSYCGSNNINLLTPSGQFGTRRMGGKDSASTRYIFTKLEKITRTIFHPDDDALLNYLTDDGMSIEPEFYLPVIPMVLVNGSDGIGTGWSSNVPNFDPRHVIANLRRMINDEELLKMAPHYYGFTGEVIPDGKREGSFIVRGKIERNDDTTLHISELPIKTWTQNYKQFLEVLLHGDDKKKKEPEIQDFQENHTDTSVSFTIKATKERIDAFEKEKNGLYGKFKLTSTLSTSNMTLFDKEGRLVRHETPEDILAAFYETRLHYYGLRKDLLLENLRREKLMLSNKARFVEEVCSGDLVVSNRKRSDILSDLRERGYDLMNNKSEKETRDDDEQLSDSEEEDTASDAELAKGYEYLLGMKIWSLTFEKAEQLRRQLREKIAAVEELQAKPPSKIWLDDLDSIEIALSERDAEIEAAAAEELKAQSKAKRSRAKGSKKKAVAKKRSKKKKKADEWDSDASSDDSDYDESIKARAKPTKLKRPAAKRPAVQKPKSIPKPASKPDVVKEEIIETSDDEVEKVPLLERMMKKKLMVSPIAEKVPSKGKKRPSPRELTSDLASEESDDAFDFKSDSLDDFDVSNFKPASVTPARKKAAKKPVAKRAKAASSKPQKKKPASKRKVVLDLDSESDEFSMHGDSDSVSESPVKARTQGKRGTKVNYALMEESDDDDSDY